MLIIGPSLIILGLATLFVLLYKFMTGRRKGIHEKRVIREENLYTRGVTEEEEYRNRYREENPKPVDPSLRKDDFFLRKNEPEPECC